MPNPRDPQEFNRFTYVGNNPLRYSDPTGHERDPNVLPIVEHAVDLNDGDPSNDGSGDSDQGEVGLNQMLGRAIGYARYVLDLPNGDGRYVWCGTCQQPGWHFDSSKGLFSGQDLLNKARELLNGSPQVATAQEVYAEAMPVGETNNAPDATQTGLNTPAGWQYGSSSHQQQNFATLFSNNLAMTNAFFFGFPENFTRTGIGILVGSSQTMANELGTVTLFGQALRSVFFEGRGIANLTIRNTLISGAINSSVGALTVGISLETGIIAGSAINAGIQGIYGVPTATKR